MNITTLENGDRQLELSEHERDTLIQVAAYLRDHYDDLDFGARNFTLEQAKEVLDIFNRFATNLTNSLPEDDAELLETIYSGIASLIPASILDENESLETVSSDFFNLLFDNLGTAKYMQGIIS